MADAVRTAAGAALVLGALGARALWLGALLALAGVVVGLAPLRRLLPAGHAAAHVAACPPPSSAGDC